MGTRRHGKDIVQLLQRPLLGLRQEEEDQDQGHEVQGGVETEGPLRFHGHEHGGKGEREHRGPEIVGCHGPGHAHFSMREGEDLCRISEGDRAFAGGIKHVEHIDEERDQTEMGITALGDPETKAHGKQGPTHIGKCKDEQRPSSESVDGEHSGPCKQEVDQTETPGGEKGCSGAGSCLLKDSRRVESNNVD